MRVLDEILTWCEASISEEDADIRPYIDEKKIDLQREYQRLNKKLFDNKLGIYPIKWNRKKTSGALVKKHVVTRGKTLVSVSVLGLEVSSFYSQSLDQLRDRLAHEMIHVKLLEQGLDVKHGAQFKAEVKRVNRLGMHVTLTEAPLAQGMKVKNRKTYGVFLPNYAREYGFVVPEKRIADWKKELVQASSNYRLPPSAAWDVYTSDLEWLVHYPNPKKGRKQPKIPRQYKMNPEQFAELLSVGKKVGTVKAVPRKD